jgi:hypothetical protein
VYDPDALVGLACMMFARGYARVATVLFFLPAGRNTAAPLSTWHPLALAPPLSGHCFRALFPAVLFDCSSAAPEDPGLRGYISNSCVGLQWSIAVCCFLHSHVLLFLREKHPVRAVQKGYRADNLGHLITLRLPSNGAT